MKTNSKGQFEKLLPPDIRAEIADAYYLENKTQKEIAKQYHVNQSTISRIINDVEVMQSVLKATTASKIRALVRVHQHLDEAVDTQIELMRGQYEDQYKYLKQNAARDILDRGGVRAEKEESAETRVIVDFGSAGGLTLGVPDHTKDNEEAE
jgi:plasmid maintenance system antidote protein VapI